MKAEKNLNFDLPLSSVRELKGKHPTPLPKATATAAWLPGEEFTWKERGYTSL